MFVSFTLSHIAGFDWWESWEPWELFSQTKQTFEDKIDSSVTAENKRILSLAKNWKLKLWKIIFVPNEMTTMRCSLSCSARARARAWDQLQESEGGDFLSKHLIYKFKLATSTQCQTGKENGSSRYILKCRTKHLIYKGKLWMEERRHKIGDEEVWLPRRLDKNWHRDLQSICRGE